MRIFKNDDFTNEIPAYKFSRTLKCLAKANWAKNRDAVGRYEYHGYSHRNMQKAFKAKRLPYIYSHYGVSFDKDGNAFVENNNSTFWVIKFDTKKEANEFKRTVIMPNYFSFKKKN